MLEIPRMRIQDLKGNEKRMMICLIRMLCKDICNESHLGLEASEEALTELINKGLAKIFYSQENETFWVTYYDFKTQSYIRNGENN